MKHYLPKNAEDASALILTLLVIVLLSTVVTSFLSSTRTEQTATRNYTSKTQAEQFASSATQQAMAKIQQGFTVNGTGNTTVITTQPGAISQYTFANGNCSVVSGKAPVELFSTIGTTTANLNNLQNPSSNSSATSNQWTITGNASEQINVPLENITSNGTVIGRIAYYVDDEGSKLNLNAAIGDRATLNVGSSRSLSLSTLVSSTQATNFTQTINGTTNNANSIQNWSHFFRPEQLAGLFGGNAAISGNLSKFSTAPIVGSDYHLKKTPWGTDRLFINDLTTDSANATASVNAIYNALSDTRLRDIYGATFADKYTDLGLKQIAANILQLKDPNTNTASNSFNSTVPRIGANASELVSIANCCNTAIVSKKIPAEYFGLAPYPFINEIGMTAAWTNRDWYDGTSMVTFQLCSFVSIMNPTRSTVPMSEVSKWRIDMKIDSFTMDITYMKSDGTVITKNFGPTGYDISPKDPWGHDATEMSAKRNARNSIYGTPEIQERGDWGDNSGYWYTTALGNYTLCDSTPWARDLRSGEELQLGLYIYPYAWGTQGLTFTMNTSIQILDISNIKVKYEYITLSSVTGTGNSSTSTLRDYVLGSDTDEIDVWLLAPHPENPTALPKGWPGTTPWVKTWTHGVHPIEGVRVVPPSKSIKRVDGRLKFSANMTTKTTANMTANMTQRGYMRSWSASGNHSWLTKAGGVLSFSSANSTANVEAYPSVTSANDIPGDPVTDQTSPSYDPAAPFSSILQFTSANTTTPNSSVFTSPQELGKIHTNVQHRKLRFTTQHPSEVATAAGGSGNQTFIPDWAMLDVISFGSNVTTVPNPAPVNLNGKFYVPTGSPQPAARTAGVEAALKALDSATLVSNPFNSSNSVTTNRTQYIGGSGNVSSTIASNIGNLTWSTGSFTSGNSTWGKGNSTNDDPGGIKSRRKTAGFPTGQFVLPAEVTEIRSLSDVTLLDSYTSGSSNIKGNEGRLSALFPGATTQSRFFTIYAYAQALDKAGNIDSEQVTKTLVEVVQTNSTTPATYKVVKHYTQPISTE